MEKYGESLMGLVVSKKNLLLAAKAVRQNKGAAGVDGMTVHEVEAHIIEFYPHLRRKLLDGTYKPQPVRRVEIPKPNGGGYQWCRKKPKGSFYSVFALRIA